MASNRPLAIRVLKTVKLNQEKRKSFFLHFENPYFIAELPKFDLNDQNCQNPDKKHFILKSLHLCKGTTLF